MSWAAGRVIWFLVLLLDKRKIFRGPDLISETWKPEKHVIARTLGALNPFQSSEMYLMVPLLSSLAFQTPRLEMKSILYTPFAMLTLWARKMLHSVKCLVCKPEGLGLDLQHL